MIDLEIRIATPNDLESLAQTLAPGISKPQLKSRLEESLTGLRTMLVAINKGRVVGVVSIGGTRFQRKGSLRLFALDVGQTFRRKGVGTAMVRAVEDIAASKNLQEVNLEVAIDNKDAIRLYRKLGYRKLGEPVIDRWQRILDDGTTQTIKVPVLVMVKKLDLPSKG